MSKLEFLTNFALNRANLHNLFPHQIVADAAKVWEEIHSITVQPTQICATCPYKEDAPLLPYKYCNYLEKMVEMNECQN